MEMMIAFVPLFSQRVWPQGLTLVIGVLLAAGKRTVSQILRVMGLGEEPQFQRYHRVLNRAVGVADLRYEMPTLREAAKRLHPKTFSPGRRASKLCSLSRRERARVRGFNTFMHGFSNARNQNISLSQVLADLETDTVTLIDC